MGMFLSSHFSAPNKQRPIADNDISDSSDDDDEQLEAEFSDSTSEDAVMSRHGSSTSLNGLAFVDRPLSDMDTSDINLDAAVNSFEDITCEKINLNRILKMEKEFDVYEKVALIYLLWDEVGYALSILTLNDAEFCKRNVLLEWAKYERDKNNKWELKLVEALAIIQNYQILKQLGFDKNEINTTYLPQRQFTSRYVNTVKKCVYLICEKLNVRKTELFLQRVKADFIRKNLQFRNDFASQYLEIYFLYWESIQYIKYDNYNNVISVFKQLDFDDCYNHLMEVLSTTNSISRTPQIRNNQSLVIDDRFDFDDIFENINTVESMDNNVYIPTTRNITDNCYQIDAAKPGICLIIDQEHFYTEVDPKYTHLLPPQHYRLERREGTTKDREVLEKTFKKFNFKVVVRNDRTHDEILEEVNSVAKTIDDESSFVLCILSHGCEGYVYGVNSCRVSVAKIQEVMYKSNAKKLNGKPKILILQSCQGSECQTLPTDDDNDDIVLDGPTTSQTTVPSTADMLVFWATVPGYAAVRNKKCGSWFIQSLCEKIRVLSNSCHLSDIFTRIINDVSSKTWQKQCDTVSMVPMMVSTLRKDFYLPPPFRST